MPRVLFGSSGVGSRHVSQYTQPSLIGVYSRTMYSIRYASIPLADAYGNVYVACHTLLTVRFGLFVSQGSRHAIGRI